MHKHSRRYLMYIIPVVLLSGCFTGIESTPKISSKDLHREQIRISPEEIILNGIAPQPFSQWQPGKEFFVTDTKLEMALDPTSSAVPAAGEIIRYNTWRPVSSVAGTDDTEILFTTPSGEDLVYRVNATYSDLEKRQRLEIPFTIELSVVDSVKKRLENQRLYIRNSTWYDSTGTHTVRGMKYIPVVIKDVLPGNLVYPVRIIFESTAPDAPSQASLYMAIDNTKGSRSFASLFSIADPRNSYPTITEENWDNIIHSRVAKFMTREECRLALGSPKSVQRYNAITSLKETWTYDNGIYLLFDDGILTSFRQ
ncbi:MAG: hypothetical protein K2M98_06025 [Muribaculum sp.]|nr:hypothetical protein [Muribaculum sp.]